MGEGRFSHFEVETPYGPQRMADGGVWRFDPRSWRLERFSQSDYNNPWGVAFDEWGQNFLADASGGDNWWLLPLSLKVPHAAGKSRKKASSPPSRSGPRRERNSSPAAISRMRSRAISSSTTRSDSSAPSSTPSGKPAPATPAKLRQDLVAFGRSQLSPGRSRVRPGRLALHRGLARCLGRSHATLGPGSQSRYGPWPRIHRVTCPALAARGGATDSGRAGRDLVGEPQASRIPGPPPYPAGTPRPSCRRSATRREILGHQAGSQGFQVWQKPS